MRGINAYYPDLSFEDYHGLKDLGYDITLVAGGDYQIASQPGRRMYNAAVVELHHVKCLQPDVWAKRLHRPPVWEKLVREGDDA